MFKKSSGGKRRPADSNRRPFAKTGGGFRRFGGGGNSRGRGMPKRIDINKFINKPSAEAQVEHKYVAEHTFSDFGLSEPLVANLNKRNYLHPTAIQDQAIPHVLAGRDLLGLANTGSGKTASFLLPLINNIKKNPQYSMALIVAPTRELAVQIEKEFLAFTERMGLYSALCVGGMSMYRQVMALRRRPHFVIGTPGRLKDLMNQKALRLDQVRYFVLDEVDRMLDMGFINDVKFLLTHLPKEKQFLTFSATITPQIKGLLEGMLTDPVTVSVRTSETGAHVEQDVVRYRGREHKLATLFDLLKDPEFNKVMIFGETKFGVEKLYETLREANFKVDAIHGDKSQAARQAALNSFRRGNVNILVATDVAARGLDVPEVSHVINFDQPQNYEDYIHRIGRTGRAGKSGKALTFVQV